MDAGRVESPFNPGLREQLSDLSRLDPMIQLWLPDGCLRGRRVVRLDGEKRTLSGFTARYSVGPKPGHQIDSKGFDDRQPDLVVQV
jgi:hypothetical protein